MTNKTFNGSMVVTEEFEAQQRERKNRAPALNADPKEICEAVKAALLKYGSKFVSASASTCSSMVSGELERLQDGKCA